MTDGVEVRPATTPSSVEAGADTVRPQGRRRLVAGVFTRRPRLRLSRREQERHVVELADDVSRDLGDPDEDQCDEWLNWGSVRWP